MNSCWPGTRAVVRWASLTAALVCPLPSSAIATTSYVVTLHTSEFTGTARHLTLDWISPGQALNYAQVTNYSSDAKGGQILVEGGPAFGGLIDGVGSQAAVLRDSSFYNQLVLPLDSVGTFVTFNVGTSEGRPSAAAIPNELSFFFLNPDGTFPFQTADPLGAHALFAVDVSGQSGGDLSVFAPMRFVPPDTLLLNNSTDDVVPGDRITGRLQFRSIVPNPSPSGVLLVYAVPDPGGELRVTIFDVAGRRVAQPFAGKRTAGTWTTQWDARDMKGRLLPTGIYLVQLQMGGQSLVRRVALAR